MNLVSRYDIACPCGETISLLEENLRQIVDDLQELDKAAPQITFLCLQCNTVFRYDYLNRKPAAVIDELPETPVPRRCIVLTGCGDRRCGSPVEFVVLARSETSFEEFEKAVYAFDRTKMFCERGHHFAPRLGGLRWI